MECLWTGVVSADLSIGEVLALGVNLHTPSLIRVTDTAAGEYAVERGLDSMQSEFARLLLRSHPVHPTHAIAGAEEVISVTDDQVVTAASLLSSPYAGTHGGWIALLRL